MRWEWGEEWGEWWDAGEVLLHTAEEEEGRGEAGVPQEQEERRVEPQVGQQRSKWKF